jgi:hypothetical protein
MEIIFFRMVMNFKDQSLMNAQIQRFHNSKTYINLLTEKVNYFECKSFLTLSDENPFFFSRYENRKFLTKIFYQKRIFTKIIFSKK